MIKDDGQLLGYLNYLMQAGHPDPYHALERIDRHKGEDGNLMGVDPGEARRHGVSDVQEPVLSVFADTQIALGKGKPPRGSVRMQDRVQQAMYAQTQPVDPFFRPDGTMISQRPRAAADDRMVDLVALKKKIKGLIDG